MVVEASCNDFDGFGIRALPGLQGAETATGVLAAVGPEDGAKIGENGFPIGRGDSCFDIAKQVNNAELMNNTQQACNGGLDAFMLVRNNEPQRLNVYPAFKQMSASLEPKTSLSMCRGFHHSAVRHFPADLGAREDHWISASQLS